MKSFPYSRHSSYKELRHLVGKFRPLDVYPCVVDENNWSESRSIRALFGDLCYGDRFAHDEEMRLLQAQLRRDAKREAVPNHNMRISEHGSSQLVPEESQWKDSDPEDQKWLEQLRMLKPPMATLSTKMRDVPPMKGALKREASEGDTQDGGLTFREKRSRMELETTTRGIKGREQRTECGGRKVKIELLSDREEEPGVRRELQIERVNGETEDEEGGKEAREGVPRDAVDETHLLVDLRGNYCGSQAPPKQTGTSSFPLDDCPWRNSNEGRSSERRGNENQKPHTSRNQSTRIEVSSGETEGSYLTEEQKCPATTQPSARPTSAYQGEAPPDAANQNQSSTSNTRAPKGVFGIHITGHLPLPLPPDMDENFDLQELREATMSALQISGRSWWNVNLQSTRRKWKYEKEVEL